MDWSVYKLWSFPWYQNPEIEQAELKKRLQQKVQKLDPSLPFIFSRVDHRSVRVQGWTRRERIQKEDIPSDIEEGTEPKENPRAIHTLLVRVLETEGPLSFDMLATRISMILKVKNTKRNRDAITLKSKCNLSTTKYR